MGNPDDRAPAGSDAASAAGGRLLAFQREALAEIEIASADDLDEVLDLLADVTLARVLATSPLAPVSEAALPEHVRELLRQARWGIN